MCLHITLLKDKWVVIFHFLWQKKTLRVPVNIPPEARGEELPTGVSGARVRTYMYIQIQHLMQIAF